MTDANREQLLVWLVRGAVAWYEAGLGEQPELLKSALQGYVEENDTLQSFIEDRCEVQPSAKTNASEFRREYIQASGGKVTQKILQEMTSNQSKSKANVYECFWVFNGNLGNRKVFVVL